MMSWETGQRSSTLISDPLQEQHAVTHYDLWPQRWCRTSPADWILGQIFCCPQTRLTRSTSEGRGPGRECRCRHRTAYGLCEGRSFGWTPLTLFPCRHFGSTVRRQLDVLSSNGPLAHISAASFAFHLIQPGWNRIYFFVPSCLMYHQGNDH